MRVSVSEPSWSSRGALPSAIATILPSAALTTAPGRTGVTEEISDASRGNRGKPAERRRQRKQNERSERGAEHEFVSVRVDGDEHAENAVENAVPVVHPAAPIVLG